MSASILDEIPHIITPRKDTGLFNSKIAIWLFLASEVMLFGGLFSGYIFLRVYADYPWPERVLPIVPGLINTFLLILSSVTVVLAWAMLKLRKWNMFRVYMTVTLLCAAAFMGFKCIEYGKKLSHQAVRLPDFTIIEGHVHPVDVDSHGHIQHGDHDSHGDHGAVETSSTLTETGGEKAHAKTQHTYADKLIFDTKSITFDVTMFNDGVVEDLLSQAKTLGAELTFSKDVIYQTSPDSEAVVVAKAGSPLSVDALEQAKDLFKKARANNATARTEELRRQWRVAKHENPGLPGWKNAENVGVDATLIADQLVPQKTSVTVDVHPHVSFLLKSQITTASASNAKIQDNTLLLGSLQDSPMELGIDAVDFTFLVMQAEEKGIDPDEAVEKSWILSHNPTVKKYWEAHKAYIANLEAELLEAAGGDEEKAKKPTEIERYKMTWKDLVRYGSNGDIDLKWYNGFAGADHKKTEWATHFPDVSVPRDQIAFESKFTPRWNNYYAIYFTITGLHGLHIIGGALVLGYYMFCPNMYRENPEWLANRVEVAGLFWHFVDLVWIFLFPILYLM